MATNAKKDRYNPHVLSLTILAALMLLVFLPWQAANWMRHYALSEIERRSQSALRLVAENLKGELAKFAVQPLILAKNPNYINVLKRSEEASRVHAVNVELERLNLASGASATYLMNASGLTVASSNWSSKKSFVGQNFAFRPYFTAAMDGRLGRYFALGTTSKKRGYYFAYPVRDGTKIIGCVVVKMDVGDLENLWRQNDTDIIVTDKNGVIFLSSNRDWLFHTTAPLPERIVASLLESRQYAGKPLKTLPVDWKQDHQGHHRFATTIIDKTASPSKQDISRTYLFQEMPMKNIGWNVYLLANTDRVGWLAVSAFLGTLLLAISVMLLGAIVYQRRRRIADRLKLQDEANETLERRVKERTAELKQTNDRLQKEIHVRSQAESELRRTQSSLVQATKLAALGQMSAGLSHEINQPLAAIGTYSDNARALIQRGDSETALKNLTSITGLIRRMAKIITNLRTYARNEPIALTAVSLNQAIEAALAILNQRIVIEKIDVSYESPAPDIFVQGGEVRLQQVFVNLIANALDAMAQAEIKKLTIEISKSDLEVQISVKDTGLGIAADQIANVFDPFYSTKQTGQGLGLGLSITYGIVQQFGGKISASNCPERGAQFIVFLNRAAEKQGKVA